MTIVYVLMEDGGYDGDTLLGVYSSHGLADATAISPPPLLDWQGRPTSALLFHNPYVMAVQMDAAAECHRP